MSSDMLCVFFTAYGQKAVLCHFKSKVRKNGETSNIHISVNTMSNQRHVTELPAALKTHLPLQCFKKNKPDDEFFRKLRI